MILALLLGTFPVLFVFFGGAVAAGGLVVSLVISLAVMAALFRKLDGAELFRVDLEKGVIVKSTGFEVSLARATIYELHYNGRGTWSWRMRMVGVRCLR